MVTFDVLDTTHFGICDEEMYCTANKSIFIQKAHEMSNRSPVLSGLRNLQVVLSPADQTIVQWIGVGFSKSILYIDLGNWVASNPLIKHGFLWKTARR